MIKIELAAQPTQAEFASLMGVTQPAISAMMADRRLPQNGTWLELIRAYVGQLRKTAAGPGEEVSELARQKTLLIKAQTEAQDLKNAVARGEYAPIGILADVLALASSAIVDRLDQLEGQLRKACPDLPDDAKTTVQSVIAAARNEWIRSTERAVFDRIDAMLTDQDDDDQANTEPDEGGHHDQ